MAPSRTSSRLIAADHRPSAAARAPPSVPSVDCAAAPVPTQQSNHAAVRRARANPFILIRRCYWRMCEGVYVSAAAPRAKLRHNSAREQALHAAEHAFLPRAAALVGDAVQIVIARSLEQQVVARLELVDELELERADAVPVLAGRHAL